MLMGRVPYSQEEQKFMVENAQVLSLQEIADKLGRTEKSVRSYFNTRKIATRKNNYTGIEIQYIIDNAGKYSWEHIAKELGKSSAGLRTFVHRRGIKGAYTPSNKSIYDKVVKCQGLMCCNYFRIQRKWAKYCSKSCDYSASNVRRYGITVLKWQELYVTQNGKCVCGKLFTINQVPVIDHNHACCSGYSKACGTCVRSLLCSSCNWLLGHAKDNPQVLRIMADYLERYDKD
jgi:hypothetical protein